MEKLNKLILDLESDCKEIREMIHQRILDCTPDSYMEENLYDPFSLDVWFADSESTLFHTYDVARLEAFEEILRELKKIINE